METSKVNKEKLLKVLHPALQEAFRIIADEDDVSEITIQVRYKKAQDNPIKSVTVDS